MSANTSFATTTSTLTQFIAKQKITNSNITSDLSSTEYPIATNEPLSFLRSDILKSTTISINQATALQSGYISNTDWNIFNGKLTSITPGTNISSTGGINPNVSLSISSQIDMSNNPLTRISSQDFNTNIDIKQAGISRIYTTSGVNSDMTITPQGNLRILSDVSLNGKTLDMGGNGVINGISNENFPTNIDLRQNNVKRIYTRNVNGNMNIDSTGLYLNSDVSFNGNLEVNNKDILNVRNQSFNIDININQGITSRIKTNGTTNMTLSAPGYLNITTDVSMNGNTIYMDSGNIIDVSGIYGVSNKNMRIDASSVTFTNNAITHMVIDNCGIILNDISYGDTGTVLSFNTSNNRVHYYPLYESSFNVMNIFLGNGGTTHNFNLKIKKVADTVTLNIPDASCICDLAGAKIGFSSRIDAKYRPSSNINFPAIIYQNTTYSIGKFQVLADGSMNLYKNLDESAGWTDTTNPSGMPGQCFTYTV
jgi:hypothetical protein